jgi:hypothetical protein
LILDHIVSLPESRNAELRTSLDYVNEVRRIAAAMPVSGEAS